MIPEDLNFNVASVGHLPLIRAVIDDLGITQAIDARCPKHAQAQVSDADCVVLLILNILSGRVALHRMNDWLDRTDIELLLGSDRPAASFHDTRLGAALDHLHTTGVDTLMGDIVDIYLHRPELPRSFCVHQDTTSLSVYGDYEDAESPIPTFGFSKDHRPDLRQLIFGLTLHGATAVPLLGAMFDGNTADVTANRHALNEIAKRLPEPEQVTFVGDCKLVDGETVAQILDLGMHFVSLLPDTFDLRHRIIEATWEADPEVASWPELMVRPGRTKADPVDVWRGWSCEHPFTLKRRDAKNNEILETRDLRFLVIHSTSGERRFDDALESKLKAEREAISKIEARIARQPLRCSEDAARLAGRHRAELRYHDADVTIQEVQRPLKRGKAGRPKRDEPIPTETVWTVSFTLRRDDAAIARTRRIASCFALITDHPESGAWSDKELLAAYKRQHIVEGATGFHWLKGPAAVAPTFLKTPTRIAALGFVFLLALMVRNHIQFTLRRQLKDCGDTILHPFTKQQVQNPTTEIALVHFGGITTLQLPREDGSMQRVPQRLRPEAEKILWLLGFDREIFMKPPDGRSRRRENREVTSA